MGKRVGGLYHSTIFSRLEHERLDHTEPKSPLTRAFLWAGVVLVAGLLYFRVGNLGYNIRLAFKTARILITKKGEIE